MDTTCDQRGSFKENRKSKETDTYKLKGQLKFLRRVTKKVDLENLILTGHSESMRE